MTTTHSQAVQTARRNGRSPQRASKTVATRRILAAVDGSERTNAIVDYLIAFTGSDDAVEVIVLNVQPMFENWRLRGYGSFKQDEVRDRLTSDIGMPIVLGVGRRLQKTGMAFTARVEIGDPVETIIDCAARERCSLIVVGDPSPGPLRRWITRTAGVSFGSVAGNVAQLATVPVVIAK